MINDVKADARALRMSMWRAAATNRGFHALVVYRLAHMLHRLGIPIVPLALTRVIQMLYGIDIEPFPVTAPTAW